jgi:hypothetical protein
MQRNTGASKPALLRFRLQLHTKIDHKRSVTQVNASDGNEPVGGIDRTGAIDPLRTFASTQRRRFNLDRKSSPILIGKSSGRFSFR